MNQTIPYRTNPNPSAMEMRDKGFYRVKRSGRLVWRRRTNTPAIMSGLVKEKQG